MALSSVYSWYGHKVCSQPTVRSQRRFIQVLNPKRQYMTTCNTGVGFVSLSPLIVSLFFFSFGKRAALKRCSFFTTWVSPMSHPRTILRIRRHTLRHWTCQPSRHHRRPWPIIAAIATMEEEEDQPHLISQLPLTQPFTKTLWTPSTHAMPINPCLLWI